MKTFKRASIFLILLQTIFFCTNGDDSIFIKRTLEEFDYKDQVIFYKSKSNAPIKDDKKFVFLDGNQLINILKEDFFTLNIEKKNNETIISVYSYSTGKNQICFFRDGKLIKKDTKYIKPMETKPYYIYYEIKKRKYPNYMNWKMFPIPKDSLK